jgi:hypothetical protein
MLCLSSMGFGRYPSWITRDWDPVNGYVEGDDPLCYLLDESPPDTLSKYRQHYAAAFEELALPGYDCRQTRLSHIPEAIFIARNSRLSRDWIVPKLLDHVFNSNPSFSDFEFGEA